MCQKIGPEKALLDCPGKKKAREKKRPFLFHVLRVSIIFYIIIIVFFIVIESQFLLKRCPSPGWCRARTPAGCRCPRTSRAWCGSRRCRATSLRPLKKSKIFHSSPLKR